MNTPSHAPRCIDTYTCINGRICDPVQCSLAKHILLCIVTFGVWYYIWIYRTTKFLNLASNVDYYTPTSQLLLCMFVPFYQIFWYYKHGQRVDALSDEMGLKYSKVWVLRLIFSIFIPFVASLVMQDRMNTICKTPIT